MSKGWHWSEILDLHHETKILFHDDPDIMKVLMIRRESDIYLSWIQVLENEVLFWSKEERTFLKDKIKEKEKCDKFFICKLLHLMSSYLINENNHHLLEPFVRSTILSNEEMAHIDEVAKEWDDQIRSSNAKEKLLY